MPKVYPFRGVRFDPEKVGDLTKVTTQPYDKIDAALKDEYYKSHEYNAIRIINRKEEEGRDKYADAATTMQDWLDKGVLIQEEKPSLYVYHQIHKTGQGVRTRKGLSALVNIEEPGKGKILPHEETHSGPKVDRLALLRQPLPP